MLLDLNVEWGNTFGLRKAMQQNPPDIFPPIPKDTSNAARSVFGGNNFYLLVGDHANELFSGLALVQKLSERTAAMLYLATVFQYIEVLSNCLAADALRKRIDWKYALHLPFDYPGLDDTVFCEFRKDLIVEGSNMSILSSLLLRLSEITQGTSKRAISLEAADVVYEVCFINRLALVWGSIKKLLGALAVKNPEWLSLIALPYWYERYSQRRNALLLLSNLSEQVAFADAIGRDGLYLMEAIKKSNISGLENLLEIADLKRIWIDQYSFLDEKIVWKKDTCAQCISAVLV